MSIAEIFYLTATIVLVLVGVLAIYITYQIYLLRTFAVRNFGKMRQTLVGISAARYSVQAIMLKTLVNLLGGGEKK